MNTFTEAQKRVYQMLTTSTGSHMCDSGGVNGRNWQRNQGKTIEDFYNEEEEKISFDSKYKELYREVSVFHYLSELELDNICKEFNSIQDESDDWDAECDAYGVSFQAWSHLESCFDIDLQRVWNTYNGESDLSQVLQGANLTINNEDYVLIQIHQGADVRGGYTNAYLFKTSYSNSGMIHGCLWEYKESSDIKEEISEFGYYPTILDYWDETKFLSLEAVAEALEIELT